MRLRPRFTLWFSLAALVPIAAAAVVTRDVVSRSYMDEFARVRQAAEVTLRREHARLETAVSDVLASMEHHPLVDGVFVELRKHGGELPAETRREIKRRAGEYLRGLGLDVLFLVETGDRVLAAPHYRPAQDTALPAPAARAQALDGRAYYALEPTMRKGSVVPVLTASAARQFRDGRHRLTVVVGQEVGAALLDTVRQPDRIHARIVDAGGRELVPPAAPWPTGAADVLRLPLPGPDGDAPAAWIEAAISRADLERLLARVTVSALMLAGAALVFTVLLGVFVARRMTRDLDRLVEGAQAAARGDLEHRVDVRARDEIGAVATSFNLMMEDLRASKERLVMAERVAAWQEIARRLAHEIKNPLTPIQMAVETLRKTWKKQHPSFDEIFEESTATVLEETARLKRILGEFAQFARMPKPALQACDLNEIVSSCLALYGGSAPVTRRLAEDLPPIHADRDQLSQVLINLLENARDALADMPADHAPHIAVETRVSARGDHVELLVEDNGPGIPEPVREKLFTPYFTTKQTKGGTGLGLAIVHRILIDHGGRVSVHPSGHGACFLVELPVHEPGDKPGAEPGARPPRGRRAASQGEPAARSRGRLQRRNSASMNTPSRTS